MKCVRKIRAGLLALAGVSISACAADGTWRFTAAEPGLYPPAVFSHRVGTPHVVLYWNCSRPEPGMLRVDGVAQNAGSPQAVRFLELELAGVDARERHVSQAAAALPDILLHTNQISPFRLDVRTEGSEVRFDLFYRYEFQENGHPVVVGAAAGKFRLATQFQRFMARDVCSETQHRVQKPSP